MPITDTALWNSLVEANTDPYGKACIDVAREVMRAMDDGADVSDPHKLIDDADAKVCAGGITGFQAGCVAKMVSQLHSRGEEFRVAWNAPYGIKPETPGTANPAILTPKE